MQREYCNYGWVIVKYTMFLICLSICFAIMTFTNVITFLVSKINIDMKQKVSAAKQIWEIRKCTCNNVQKLIGQIRSTSKSLLYNYNKHWNCRTGQCWSNKRFLSSIRIPITQQMVNSLLCLLVAETHLLVVVQL